MADQHTPQDPQTQYPQPEQPEQTLEYPGVEGDMEPRPDYGYDTYRGSGKLEGRRAVITGGDSGIGRAVALAFAREGADVLISHLPAEQADADETVRVVQETGRKAISAPGDLQDPAYCRQIVERDAPERGREVRYRLRPGALAPAAGWLARTERAWDDRLARLREVVEQPR